MSWLIFLGNLAKILFLDTHAKILQVRTYIDIILPCYMARSWQDFPRLSMFLIKAIKFHFTGLCYFMLISSPILKAVKLIETLSDHRMAFFSHLNFNFIFCPLLEPRGPIFSGSFQGCG